jgi:hypothetical protein
MVTGEDAAELAANFPALVELGPSIAPILTAGM